MLTVSNHLLSGSLVAVILMSGCASKIPQEITNAPDQEPAFSEIKESPASYFGRTVRWGGVIAIVRNEATITRVEVVQKVLDRYGRPVQGDQSGGRFFALVEAFLDPALYSPGRRFTAVGAVADSQPGLIGDFPYDFPVVMATHHQLWPKPLPRRYRRSRPYWHGPFYDPWYHPWYGHWHGSWRYSHGPYPKRYQARQIRRTSS